MLLRVALVGLLLGLLTLSLTAGSFAASAEKATGYVEYEAAGLYRALEFNAHEAFGNRPAKGILSYSDANGDWYTVDVQYVNVDPATMIAYIAGPVVSASQQDWVGLWLSAAVYDGGTPGREGDAVAGIFTDIDTAIANVSMSVVPGDWYDVLAGNLVVHAK